MMLYRSLYRLRILLCKLVYKWASSSTSTSFRFYANLQSYIFNTVVSLVGFAVNIGFCAVLSLGRVFCGLLQM